MISPESMIFTTGSTLSMEIKPSSSTAPASGAPSSCVRCTPPVRLCRPIRATRPSGWPTGTPAGAAACRSNSFRIRIRPESRRLGSTCGAMKPATRCWCTATRAVGPARFTAPAPATVPNRWRRSCVLSSYHRSAATTSERTCWRGRLPCSETVYRSSVLLLTRRPARSTFSFPPAKMRESISASAAPAPRRSAGTSLRLPSTASNSPSSGRPT